MGRVSAREKRESVIRTAIARRVGGTRPYFFRLFQDKKTTFGTPAGP